MNLRFLFLFIGISYFCLGQQSKEFTLPKSGTVQVSSVNFDLQPLVQRLEMPSPIPGSEKAMLKAIKESLNQKSFPKRNEYQSRLGQANDPWMGPNFRGNNYINGVPNDNDLAISKSGIIVSVVNSNIIMMNDTGLALASLSLEAWSDTLNLNATKFDPRALYDPLNDRYIIACLNGFASNNSKIILGFSETNDPTGNWNLYALPGSPYQDTSWTDYPIMALSHGELFITGNLIYDNMSWQAGFKESIIWQINTQDGYQGDSLTTLLHNGVNFGGKPIRNLCPVQEESENRRSDIYFTSNRNFDLQNDTVFLIHLSDSIGGNPNLSIDFLRSNQNYGMPPNGQQPFNHDLATNDARWLDAIMVNNTIHMVGNSIDTLSGNSVIYHATIENPGFNPLCTGTLIGDTAVDYGYPGLAWAGIGNSNDLMIAVNYSGAQNGEQPGCGAIFFDAQSKTYSNLVVSKTGENVINMLNGTDRWGDYTGIQRRYGQEGKVWIAATYGRVNRQPGTWIAEYNHPGINVSENEIPSIQSKLYPNPVYHTVHLDFTLHKDTWTQVSLYTLDGKLVKNIMYDRFRAGVSRLTIETSDLPNGIYLLKLEGDNLNHSKKFIVAH